MAVFLSQYMFHFSWILLLSYLSTVRISYVMSILSYLISWQFKPFLITLFLLASVFCLFILLFMHSDESGCEWMLVDLNEFSTVLL